jgi:3',5'-nucleoside bisphosphate phosphatase
MLMKIVDLHTHSNISDGSYTPSEIMQQAHQVGIGAIALTDHDTIAGVSEAEKQAKKLGVEFLPGMEMSVKYNNRRLHIVALGFDRHHPAFQTLYKKIRGIKEAGVAGAVEKIRAKEIDVSMAMLEKNFTTTDNVDRYAIMRYFVSLNMFDNVQKIWDNYINPAFTGFDSNITVEEGLSAIKAAGGVTSLAHFHKRLGLGGMTRSEQEVTIQELMALGLDGMEGYYPNYSEEDQVFATYLIDKYKMLPTGGTDFHGKNRSNVVLGTGIDNNMSVPYEWYQNIENKCK